MEVFASYIDSLLGNKMDREDREIPMHVGEDFAQRHDMYFLETSAKEAENVEKLFMEIAAELMEVSHSISYHWFYCFIHWDYSLSCLFDFSKQEVRNFHDMTQFHQPLMAEQHLLGTVVAVVRFCKSFVLLSYFIFAPDIIW